MQEIKKIMVAVDLSDFALPTVQYAHELATALGAGIFLVNIFNERDVRAIRSVFEIQDAAVGEKLIYDKLENRRKMVAKLAERAGAQQPVVQSIVQIGVPHQALLKVIKQQKPDLIVMGTKGRSNLADVLVGSCARKVFRRSPIPVLLLPRAAKP